jgi:hypothetical protein
MSLSIMRLNPHALSLNVNLQLSTPVVGLRGVHKHVIASYLLKFFVPFTTYGFSTGGRRHQGLR